MVELSTENKALCFEDSAPKPLYIFLYVWVEEEVDGYYNFFKNSAPLFKSGNAQLRFRFD